MLRGVFVTGTDTGVGKTVVAAGLVSHIRRRLTQSFTGSADRMVRYWKPVQTGIEQDDDTATVKYLAACRDDECLDEGVRLPRPVSPHLAARLSGTVITLDRLTTILSAQPATGAWVVEGAGGVLVPLNDSDFMIDLMASLGLPAVVVTRSTLGTINHTLLTLEVLRSRGLSVAGVVVNGPSNPDNCEAISRYGRVPVLGRLHLLEPLSPDALRQWAEGDLDPDEFLLKPS